MAQIRLAYSKTGKYVTQRPRKKLEPSSVVLASSQFLLWKIERLQAKRPADIETELRRLSLEDHTNAVSVLFRVFLELSVDSYLEDNPLPKVDENSNLGTKVEKVSLDLEKVKNRLNKQQGRAIRSGAMGGHSFLAPNVNTMHGYVHNKYVFPSPSDLRAGWDNMQPFIAAIWTP